MIQNLINQHQRFQKRKKIILIKNPKMKIKARDYLMIQWVLKIMNIIEVYYQQEQI
jgi:hypothetical protein